MKKLKRLGFIGGGMMAEALISGLITAELVDCSEITVVEPVIARCNELIEKYKVEATEDPKKVWHNSDTVIIAVKPQIIKAALDQSIEQITERHLLISIAAGVSLSALESQLDSTACRVIRVMPNTPALVGEGAAALSAGTRAGEDDMEVACQIFNSIGSSVIVSEPLMDAVTGLSGSGPAYVFSFIEALIDGGVSEGLSRDVARQLALQTVIGSTKLLLSSNKHPAELKSNVTSPAGTTIAGLYEMEKSGFKGIVMSAIKAAAFRSRELGRLVKK
jgi:pyrroline-5-carboxylate reductase